MIILGRTEILVQMDPTDLILKIAGFDDIECRVFPKMPLYSLELDDCYLQRVQNPVTQETTLTSHIPSLTLRIDSGTALSSVTYFGLKTMRSMSAVCTLNMESLYCGSARWSATTFSRDEASLN